MWHALELWNARHLLLCENYDSAVIFSRYMSFSYSSTWPLFFFFCSLNISLSCDTTMTKRTLKWSGHTSREGSFQMSVSQGMKYKMPLGTQRSSFGIFPIQIYTARKLCDSRILRQGKRFFSLVKIIHCLLSVSRGISIPWFCAHFCIPQHSTTLHVSNSFPVALWSMAATPSHQDLHWYIMLEHLFNKNYTE